MDLLITSFGTRIRRQHEQIVLEVPKENALRRYPARRLERILIMESSSISADAVELAMEHGVDISYIGRFGKPEARIVPTVPTGFTKVRHAQFRTVASGEAFLYARQFVFGKVKNQIAMGMALGCDSAILTQMEEALRRAEAAEQVPILMSAEGAAADCYFSGVWSHVFQGVGRDQGGHDRVNAALNYGYGILYNEVERALLFAGLDPFVGMLHSERYGKPSLTLDFIEEFRVLGADAVLLPLFAKGLFHGRDFDQKEAKIILTTYGRKKIVREIFAQLNLVVNWRGSKKKLSSVVTEQAQSLARSLLKGERSYEPFVASQDAYEKSIATDRRLVEKP